MRTLRTSHAVFVALCGLLFGLFLFVPHFAHGQAVSDATLTFDPSHPSPGEQVRVFVEAYSVDVSGADIRWYVDGVENVNARGARSITLQLGPLGRAVPVRTDVAVPGSGTFTLQRTVVPTAIDLIVEADTYTPPFYKGRSLPAPDEPVTAVVIPYVGANTNAGALVYTWRLGGTVLFGGPVLGKTHARFTMPKRQSILSVQVATQNGTPVGEQAVVLKSASPEMYFYEDNPLRGLNFRTIGEQLTLVEEETTVRAEPYFVARDIFARSPDLQWTIGGQTAASGERSNALTLARNGTRGEARVEFSLTNRQSLLQTVHDSFTVFFE